MNFNLDLVSGVKEKLKKVNIEDKIINDFKEEHKKKFKVYLEVKKNIKNKFNQIILITFSFASLNFILKQFLPGFILYENVIIFFILFTICAYLVYVLEIVPRIKLNLDTIIEKDDIEKNIKFIFDYVFNRIIFLSVIITIIIFSIYHFFHNYLVYILYFINFILLVIDFFLLKMIAWKDNIVDYEFEDIIK